MSIKCRLISPRTRIDVSLDENTKLGEVFGCLFPDEQRQKTNPLYPIIMRLCRRGIYIDGLWMHRYNGNLTQDTVLRDVVKLVEHDGSHPLHISFIPKIGGDSWYLDGDGVPHYQDDGCDCYFDLAAYQTKEGNWYLYEQSFVSSCTPTCSYYYDPEAIERRLAHIY